MLVMMADVRNCYERLGEAMRGSGEVVETFVH